MNIAIIIIIACLVLRVSSESILEEEESLFTFINPSHTSNANPRIRIYYGMYLKIINSNTTENITISPEILKERLALKIGKSNVTGFDWRTAALWLFEKQANLERSGLCPPRRICELVQTKGLYGNIEIRTPHFQWHSKLVKFTTVNFSKPSESCGQREFTCDNNLCVDKRKVCNGEDDCGDGSDEDAYRCSILGHANPKTNCSANEFRCGSDQCIPFYLVCNSIPNCPDGSDEYREECSYTTPRDKRNRAGLYFPYQFDDVLLVKGFWGSMVELPRALWLTENLNATVRPSYVCRIPESNRTSWSFVGNMEITVTYDVEFSTCFYASGKDAPRKLWNDPSIQVLKEDARLYWGSFRELGAKAVVSGGLTSSYGIFHLCRFLHRFYNPVTGPGVFHVVGVVMPPNKHCKSTLQDKILTRPNFDVLMTLSS